MPKMRSIMYIPGNREDYIVNMGKLNADVITLDLEDSVPKSEKGNARILVRNAIRTATGKPMYVRINSWDSGQCAIDLEFVIQQGLTGICLPKCGESQTVMLVDQWLTDLEYEKNIPKGTIKLQLLIETAKGMENAYDMAIVSNRVDSLIFGVVDFTADMGISLRQPNGHEYEWARQRVICAAIAAKVIPIDCPYMKLNDSEGFIEDTEHGKSLGYQGRLLIHPLQIEMANRIYAPSPESVAWAKEITEAYERAIEKGNGSILHNGEMVATAVYQNAKNILAQEHNLNAVTP